REAPGGGGLSPVSEDSFTRWCLPPCGKVRVSWWSRRDDVSVFVSVRVERLELPVPLWCGVLPGAGGWECCGRRWPWLLPVPCEVACPADHPSIVDGVLSTGGVGHDVVYLCGPWEARRGVVE